MNDGSLPAWVENGCRSGPRWAWVLLAVLGAACRPPALGPTEVPKVVASIPVGQANGDEFVNGARLALELHRREGGVAVDLEILDSADSGGANKAEREAAIAAQAIADPAVVAYLGPSTSDSAKVSMPLLNQAGVTQVSYSASWPGLTLAGFGAGEPGIYFPSGERHFFRVAPRDDIGSRLEAEWVASQGWRRLFMVAPDTVFARGASGIFVTAAQDLGMEVLGYELFHPATASTDSLEAMADRALATHPDVVCFTATSAEFGAAMLRRLRDRAPQLPIVGRGAVVSSLFVEQVGKARAEGIYSTALGGSVAQLPSPQAAQFRREYRQAYGREAPFRAALSFEAMTALLRAIERAQPRTRTAVLAEMHRLGEVSGVLGTWSFTASGDISRGWAGLWRVHDGEWRFVKILDDP